MFFLRMGAAEGLRPPVPSSGGLARRTGTGLPAVCPGLPHRSRNQAFRAVPDQIRPSRLPQGFDTSPRLWGRKYCKSARCMAFSSGVLGTKIGSKV